MNKIIVIYGPTAIGKSNIAIQLAKKINAEIISADSIQIYKGVDIGSAKVTLDEMQGIPHHLINIKNPDEEYSVYEFVKDCKEKINDIIKRGKNIIIVGGTGLYIKALTENYNYAETVKNQELREKLERCQTCELIEILKSYNKQLKHDDLNNRQRLIRYIEIAQSGNTFKKNNFDNRFVIFGLYTDREILYERINKRIDEMACKGLLDEAKFLLNEYNSNSQCLKAIGYKELIPYFNGEKSLNECLEILKQRTRNYAKRQITFFNQFKNLIKIKVNSKQQVIEDIIKNIEDKNV